MRQSRSSTCFNVSGSSVVHSHCRDSMVCLNHTNECMPYVRKEILYAKRFLRKVAAKAELTMVLMENLYRLPSSRAASSSVLPVTFFR